MVVFLPVNFLTMMFANLLLLVLHSIIVFIILREIIRFLLRQDNSVSTIRKTKKESTFWKRITGLCFWNMKSSCKKLLHFFIRFRVFMIMTAGVPLLLAIPLCFDTRYAFLSMGALRIAFYMDMITLVLMGSYVCTLHKKKRRKL